MLNPIVQAVTYATVASAAYSGRANVFAAPAPSPAATDPCPAHGNVTAWKVFNGDQAPGLGAALLPRHYKAGNATAGYICLNGQCAAKSVVPPVPLTTPAAYLKADPGYGTKSLDHDLASFANIQVLAREGDAAGVCFAHHLSLAFAGQPVFQSIANDANVQPATSAAFLQGYWSGVPNLSDSLQHYPEQAAFYYNLITAYHGNGSAILGHFTGNAQRPG